MTIFHRMAIGENGGSTEEVLDAEVSLEFLDRIPGGILRYHADTGKIDYMNAGLVAMFGCKDYQEFCEYTGNEFLGMVCDDDRERVEAEIAEQMRTQTEDHVRFRIVRKDDGETRWIEDHGHYVVDSAGAAWFYATLLDVTAEMRLREQLDEANERFETMTLLGTYQRMAEIDGLTGVYNRAAGVAKIQELIREGEKPCSFIIVDIDDFKGVNDTYGHPAGDRALVALARHLRNTVRAGDIVSRFGGDEFVVFAPGLGSGDALEGLLGRLGRNTFRGRRSDDDALGFPEPSISLGAAICTDGTTSYEDLYHRADQALYRAKSGGKSRAEISSV